MRDLNDGAAASIAQYAPGAAQDPEVSQDYDWPDDECGEDSGEASTVKEEWG